MQSNFTQERQDEMQLRRAYPHFLIVGAMKCGTTSLFYELAAHPDVYIPSDKEPDILHRGRNLDEIRRLYHRYYRCSAEHQLRGEASTMYTMAPLKPDVSSLAREVMGGRGKIIYIYRNPIERTISHLNHDVAAGRIDPDAVEQALRRGPQYIQTSRFDFQIRPWIDCFGSRNVICMNLDGYIEKRAQTLARLAGFLGLAPESFSERGFKKNDKENGRSSGIPLVDKVVRSRFYKEHVSPHVPSAQKDFLKRGLYKRVSSQVKLSDATMDFLEAEFATWFEDVSQLPCEHI